MISNGIDPDDLGLDQPPESQQRFRLSHVGTLYGARDAAPVFAAIRDLMAQGRLDRDRFEVRIVGHANLRNADLDSMPVTRIDYVDHQRAMAEMTDASALLFYQPPATGDPRANLRIPRLRPARPVHRRPDQHRVPAGRKPRGRRLRGRPGRPGHLTRDREPRPRWEQRGPDRGSARARGGAPAVLAADTRRRARRGPARGNLERCDDPVASTTAFMTAARDRRLRVIVAPEVVPLARAARVRRFLSGAGACRPELHDPVVMA